MKTFSGLWIGKTGDANAWYHIYPFAISKHLKHLHVVRYAQPQRKIHHPKVSFYTFNNSSKIHEVISIMKHSIKVLKKEEIDFIVTFNLVPWGSIAWVLAKIFKKPIIIGLIGTDFNSYIRKNEKNIFNQMLNKSDVVTVTGSEMAQYFKKNNFKQPVFVFPHCIVPISDSPETKTNPLWDLISVSALTKNKRTIDIIRAVRILKDRNINVTLKIVGEGAERKNLEKEIEELKITERVKLVGYQNDVNQHLRESKIFIQASLNEGLSLSLIEAVSNGLVPVITEAGSEKDIITDTVNGLYILKKNPKDMADKIEYLLDETNYNMMRINILKKRDELLLENKIKDIDRIIKLCVE